MLKSYSNSRIITTLLCCLIMTAFGTSYLTAQTNPSSSFGNTFIHSEGNLTVYGDHRFSIPTPIDGSQPGIIGGERVPTIGYFNFAPGATWVEADDTKYVDGYVRHFGNTKFLFPVGDNGYFRPAAVSGGAYVEACYFKSDPTIAVTSDIRGGNFPILPQSGPFDKDLFDDAIIKVSEYEYWDINGSDPTIITLTWDSDSNVDIITSDDLERLAIVGWNGAQWEYIPSYIDLASISLDNNNADFDGPAPVYSRGSISTKIPVIPSSYEVYTLASSCLYMDLDVSNEMMICLGEEFTLTASSYEEAELVWNTGETGPTITDMPTENTLYTVTASLGACEVTREIFVEVREMMVDLGIDTFVCSGNDITIMAESNFPGTYQWEHRGQLTFGNNTITLQNLNTPSTLNVTITDENGCTATDDLFIDIRQSPDVFTGRDASVCLGDSTFIQAFGSETGYGYLWSTGDTSSLIYVSPLQTTTYEVSLTENGCEDVSFVTVEVFPQAYIEILNDNIICPGDEVTLETEATEGTYLWSTGDTSANLTISPLAGETYSVTLTSPGSCEWNDQITFESYEVTIEAETDLNICEGETVNLSINGMFDAVLWSTGESGNQISVNPLVTTQYQATTYYGECEAVTDFTVNVDNVLEVDLGPDLSICRGESITINSNSVGQYNWSNGENTSSITVSPFTSQTYTITVTSGGCVDEDEIFVFVNENPAFVNITTDSLFCPGEQILLSANGSPGDYVWSNGNTNSSFLVSPNNGQTFSVTVTNEFGCQAIDEITFRSYDDSSVELGPDQTICRGESIQLEVEGNYQSLFWSNGSTNDFITVEPLTTTSYYVTATLNGCENYDTITVNVVDIVNLNLGPDISICAGESVELSVNNLSGDLVWSTGQTGNTVTVNPSMTNLYSVTLTSGSCVATDEIIVTVEDPFIEIIADPFYCPGESMELVANASEGTIIWSNSAIANSITVFPTPGFTYTATVISPTGCTASTSFTPSPIDLENVNLGPDQTICEGATIDLSIEGNYDLVSWSNGSIGNMITVTPLNSTSYSVTVTESNCVISDTINILVSEDIEVNLGPDIIICPGESVELVSNTTGEYTWSNGLTTSSINVSPSITTIYSLTVTSGQCQASDDIMVQVAQDPQIEITGESSICPGQETILSADGTAGTYLWNTGANTQQITVTPNPGQTYIVTVTTANGCTATDEITISSFNEGNIDLGEDMQLCDGAAIDLAINGNFDQIIWSTGENTPSITVTPTQTTTITVTAWKGTCQVTDEIVLEVVDVLNLNLGPDQTICAGQSIMLNANVAGEYLWSTGESDYQITVSPTETTTYEAFVSSGNCESSDQITVFVENQAYVDIATNSYFCQGEEILLVAEGSQGDYIWSNGQSGNLTNIFPTNNQQYAVTVTTPDGCVASDSITMLSFENRDLITEIEYDICAGESVSLFVEGTFESIQWENGSSMNPRIVSPTSTTDYTVTAFYKSCSASDVVTVIVNSDLEFDLGDDITICPGESVSLGTSISGQYTWSNGSTDQFIDVSPVTTQQYSLEITSGNCSAEDSISIIVDEPFIEIINNPVFCEEELTTLQTINSGGTFLWSTGETTPSINVVPASNRTFSVTITSPNGCTSVDQITFTKYGGGDISLGPDITICQGGSVELNVRGLYDYIIWSDGFIGSSRVLTPGNTTTYSITGVLGSCLSFDQITVFVEENLDLDLGPDLTVCPGQTVELTDINTGGDYLWSTGDNTQSIFVAPNITTTYTVTVSSGICVAQDEITVNVSDDCYTDLYVNKSSDNFNPVSGDTIELSVLVGNEGLITANNIQIKEIIRSGFKLISHQTTAGFYSPNSSVWYLDKLDPGNIELLFLTVEVLPTGDYFNIAEVIKVSQLDIDSEPNNGDETEDDYDKIDIDVQEDEEIPDNTSEIGDRVWLDTNGDGYQDNSEMGIENIEIQLFSSSNYNSPIASQLSGPDGYFCFTGLSSGAYFVKFVVPDTLVITDPKISGNNTNLDNKDSDIENTFGYGTTNMINLGLDQQIKTCDGGLYPGGKIGDLVWQDALTGVDDRYDHLIDNGVEGMIMRLYDFNMDTMVMETVTDETGYYMFENLRRGDYYVEIVAPAGEDLKLVAPDRFIEDIDSDFNPVTHKTSRITLAASEIADHIDAGISGSLPLTLVDFWGERIYDEELNRLFWTTESEFNTDKFEIQRSLDEQLDFEPIGEVQAAGNSSETLYYTFDDLNSRPAGEYYYRLKMYDLNGRFTYSPIIVIKVFEDGENDDDETSFKVYPIPTTDYLKLEISTLGEREFQGFLVNNLGQHVRTFSKRTLQEGINLLNIDVIDLAQGQYYLNFYIGEEQFITKVLILD